MSDFENGDVVEVNYKMKGKFFPAVIKRVPFASRKGNKFDCAVEYADTKGKIFGVNWAAVREPTIKSPVKKKLTPKQRLGKRKAPPNNENSPPTKRQKKHKKGKAKAAKAKPAARKGTASAEELKINLKIAIHLRQIAQETSGFKKSAILKGANIVQGLRHPLECDEKFTQHKGIGKGIAAYIQEFFDENLAEEIDLAAESEMCGDMSKRFKPTPKQKKQVAAVIAELQDAKYKNDQLKEMLKYNEQPRSGNKVALLQRIAECKIYGCLPMCPGCGATTIKLRDDDSGLYYCKGYFDDTEWTVCGYTAGHVDRPKWDDDCEKEFEKDKHDDRF